MANVLQILIEADDRASKVIAGTQEKLNAFKGNTRAMGAAVTAAAGMAGGALVAMAIKGAQSADGMLEMSQRTGLSVESLSRFKFMADQTGGSIEGVEKGSKRLSRVMYDAANGSKTAVEALGALGLSYEQLQALSPEEKFMTVTRALADVEDKTMQAAIAQQVFGRAGTEMLPMLEGGAAGFDKLSKSAEQYTITTEQAAASDEFFDSLKELQAQGQGLTRVLAANLLPAMQGLIDKAKYVVGGLSKWSQEHPTLSKGLTTVVIGLVAVMGILGPMLMILPSLKAGWLILSNVTKIAAAAQWVLNAAMSANPIGLIIIGIAALVAAGVLLIKNWDSVKYFSLQAWGYIKTTILEIIEKLLFAYSKLWGWLPIIGPKIRAAHAGLEAQIAKEREVIAARGADRRIAIAENEAKRAKAIADQQKSYMGAGSNTGSSGGIDTVAGLMSGKAADAAEKANAKIAKAQEAEEKKAAASVAREKKAILAEHIKNEKKAIAEKAVEEKRQEKIKAVLAAEGLKNRHKGEIDSLTQRQRAETAAARNLDKQKQAAIETRHKAEMASLKERQKAETDHYNLQKKLADLGVANAQKAVDGISKSAIGGINSITNVTLTAAQKMKAAALTGLDVINQGKAALAAKVQGNMSWMVNPDGTLKVEKPIPSVEEALKQMPVNNAGWSATDAWREQGAPIMPFLYPNGVAPTATPLRPVKIELDIKLTKEADLIIEIKKEAKAAVETTVRQALAQSN